MGRCFENQYLLPNSTHPPETTKVIPFILELRIVTVCSQSKTRETRFMELKEMLVEREYKHSMIEASIRRARPIPRTQAVNRVAKPNHTKRTVYTVTWDPRLPNLPRVFGKHWRSMTLSSPYIKEVFQEPPMVAYKRQTNISDIIIRVKVTPPPKNHPNRSINGMIICFKSCVICQER